MGQIPAKLLVDSGAGATLVHQKLVPTGKYTIWETSKRVTGVTGTDLGILGEARVEIEINGLQTAHNCLVVKEMENDVLIGVDFLTAGGYVLDFARTEPEIRDQRSRTYLALNREPTEQTAGLRLGKETYLPAYSRRYVRVTPNRNLDHCFEVRVKPATLEEEGVWIEDSVADIE